MGGGRGFKIGEGRARPQVVAEFASVPAVKHIVSLNIVVSIK